MVKLASLFPSVARDTSNTHLVSDVQEGYRNLVAPQHYTLKWTFERDMKKTLPLGHTIEETLFTEAASQVVRSGSGAATFSGYQNAQTGVKVSAPISYQAAPLAWNENEVAANMDPSMGKTYIKAQFEKTYGAKVQNVVQTIIDDLETSHWNAADQTAMEAGDKALSIPYYVTEETGGLALDVNSGSAMSAINGVTMAQTNSKYDNVRLQYTVTGGNSPAATDLIGRIVGAARRCHWSSLPAGAAQHGSLESIPGVVFCSNWGMDLVQAAYREHGGNQWGTMEMTPYGLTIAGMVFVNVDALETAALYTDGSSGLVTESASGATNTGPRFYGISTKHMCQLFQPGQFMAKDDPENLTAVGKPYEWVQIFKTAHQLWCADRRRHFIVYPDSDISS